MQPLHCDTELLNFLQQELALSTEEITLLLNHRESEYAPLPMLLWQYGLISLEKLNHLFDWLEHRVSHKGNQLVCRVLIEVW
ncbi:MAG: DUF2949 domain-containing protein [Leptolyngbyaceae cyanobacterium bins.59]|nr:DUF2949 domain-containing protein [Leptolyngbyaceae cyanobacterium bins.59]